MRHRTPLSMYAAALGCAALGLASLGRADTEPLLTIDRPPGFNSSWGSVLAPLHDLDGDGVRDLAIGSSQHGGGLVASVHSGATGARLFTLTAPHAALFYGQAIVSVTDAAGDGVPDLVLLGAHSGAAQSTDGWIGVYSGVDGALLRQFTPPAGVVLYSAPAVALDDVDGDGREDILCRVQDGGLGVPTRLELFSSASGAPLYGPSPLAVSASSAFTRLDDHDGDGLPDFAVIVNAGQERRVEVRSTATGATLASLTPRAAAHFTGNREPFLSVEDRDGDGLRDLALGGTLFGFADVFSSRDGASLASWSCAGSTMPCFGSRMIEVDDLDGDGHADLIALETVLQAGQTMELFALSPATGAVLFAQPLPTLFGGYSGSSRLVALPGADPLGLPTFALFDEGTRQVIVRRHAPPLGAQTCASTPNSSGAAATVRAVGLASLAADRLVLELAGAPAGRSALFVRSSAAQQAPFGLGFLCVGSTSFGRSPVGSTDAAGAWGLRVDLAAAGLGAGVTWTFQAVFRDTNAFGFQTSDAVALTLSP